MTNWIDYLRIEAPKFDVAIRTAGAATRTYAALLTTAPQEDDGFGTISLVSDVPLRDYNNDSSGPIGRLVLIDLAHFDSQLHRYMSPIQKLRFGGFSPRQLVELPWMNGDDIQRRILEHFPLLERNDSPTQDENHTDSEPQAAIPPNSLTVISPEAWRVPSSPLGKSTNDHCRQEDRASQRTQDEQYRLDHAQQLIGMGKLDEAHALLSDLIREMPADWKPIQVVPGEGATKLRVSEEYQAWVVPGKDIAKLQVASWDLEEYQAWSNAWTQQNPKGQIAFWVRPSYSCAFYQLAHIAAEREGYDAALEAVERGLALEPDHPLLLCEKGFVLGRLRRFEEALACYQQAFDARSWSPDFQKAQALRGVGTTLIELDRLEEAETALRRSLEFEADSETAHHELTYIAQVRSQKKPDASPGEKRIRTRLSREDEIPAGTVIQVGGLQRGGSPKPSPPSKEEKPSPNPADDRPSTSGQENRCPASLLRADASVTGLGRISGALADGQRAAKFARAYSDRLKGEQTMKPRPLVYLHDPEFAQFRQETNDQAAMLDAISIVDEAHKDDDLKTIPVDVLNDEVREHAIGIRIERFLQEEQEIAEDHGKTLSADEIAKLVAAERKRLDALWPLTPPKTPDEDSTQEDHEPQEAQNEQADLDRSQKKASADQGGKRIRIRSSREDEIDSSSIHIQVGGLHGRPSKPEPDNHTETPSDAQVVTGFDYASQWPEEVRIIHEQGPFSPEEIARLSMEQVEDYYYVTCWFLRDVGEEKFVAAREKLRRFFLMRLEEGERLRPPI